MQDLPAASFETAALSWGTTAGGVSNGRLPQDEGVFEAREI
jgi:hypothetical protein